jgi:hypothetical protein
MRFRFPAFASALFLGGCGIHGVEETATESFRFDVQEKPRIEVRLDEGSVEVVGSRSSSNEVRVVVVKRARGPGRKASSALLERIVVEAYREEETIAVRVRSDTRWAGDDEGISIGPSWLRSDVELHVPRETDLVLITQDGRIEIERVEGHIEAETGDGRVRLEDVKGIVSTATGDGSIVGSALDGDFDVSTEEGPIELEGRFQRLRAVSSDGRITVRCGGDPWPLTADWMIRSSDGSVELTLPSGLSAEIEASTNDGHIDSELRLVETEKTGDRIKGRLNEGGKLILVRTLEGRIRLRAS